MIIAYKTWNKRIISNSSRPTYFRFRELPNDFVAQYGDFRLKSEDLLDPDLQNLEAQLEQSKEKKLELLELNSLSSQLFRKKLEIIKKKISDHLVLEIAKLQNKTTQEYSEEILQQKNWTLNSAELEKELRQLGITEKDPAFAQIKKIAQNKKRQRIIDEEINKKFLKDPILTNLKPPTFEMPLPKDWTPHWGLETAPYTLVVFFDFATQSSQTLNKSLLELSQKRNDIRIYWRPYFENPRDPVQNLLAQASVCLWQQNQDAFFRVLDTLEKIQHDTAETDLYKSADKNKFDVEALKKCVVQQKYKDVIDYHLKYGNYLRIKYLPTLFINGEVIVGEFREEVIGNLLQSYR